MAIAAKRQRPVPKDCVLTYADVDLPEGRLVDRLRAEQGELFGLSGPASR